MLNIPGGHRGLSFKGDQSLYVALTSGENINSSYVSIGNIHGSVGCLQKLSQIKATELAPESMYIR